MIEQDKLKIEKARQTIENEAMVVLTEGMKSQVSYRHLIRPVTILLYYR